jgi:hypothetical protein
MQVKRIRENIGSGSRRWIAVRRLARNLLSSVMNAIRTLAFRPPRSKMAMSFSVAIARQDSGPSSKRGPFSGSKKLREYRGSFAGSAQRNLALANSIVARSGRIVGDSENGEHFFGGLAV